MEFSRSLEFSYDPLPGRVVFGRGASRRVLAAEVEALGLTRVLLVASASQVDAARLILEPIASLVASVFSDIAQHVPRATAEAVQALATGTDADGILSIGGGSTTGTAKIVALTEKLPIVAIPTTYAGSEMTPVWGMTTDGRKETGIDRAVLPRTVIYDSEPTETLPVALSVASGFNAMAHCVEAFWAPGNNPVTSLHAAEGIHALTAGMTGVRDGYATDGDYDSLLFGAYLAGRSFAEAGSGLHHKICHALGGAFNLPHVETHAVVLPHVLAFNAPAVPDAAARIADALGVEDASGGLLQLNRDLGSPGSLLDLGLRADQVDEAIEVVSARLPIDNPRPVDRAAIAEILSAASGTT